MLIENNNVQLFRTKAENIPFVMQAEIAQENAKYIGQWSFEQHESALNDEDILHLVVKNIAGEHIGFVILRGLQNQNNCIELMRIVITAKGHGYGKSVVSLIKKWCFELRKAHRLWLDVRENNNMAQHVYESQGFKREGVLRECIKVGDTYESLVIMAILFREYHIKGVF